MREAVVEEIVTTITCVTQQVVALITHTLEAIVTTGFDSAAVAASLNSVEFRLRESGASTMKGA